MAAPAPLRIEPKPGRQPRPWLPFVAGAALAVMAGGGYWLARRPKEPVEPPKLTKLAVLPPDGFALEGAASRQSFALSPDGTRLAFTAMDSSGEFSVFLRDFNSLEPRLVPGSEGAHTVFWPPDGRSLYLTAKGKLWRTPLEGDAHVLLADSPSFLFSGAWLGSKRILLDSFRASYFVSPSGGSLERLKDNYWWPQMLPDGEHVLYVRLGCASRPLSSARASAPRFHNEGSDRNRFAGPVYGLDGHAGYRLSPVYSRRKFAGAPVRSTFPAS